MPVAPLALASLESVQSKSSVQPESEEAQSVQIRVKVCATGKSGDGQDSNKTVECGWLLRFLASWSPLNPYRLL